MEKDQLITCIICDNIAKDAVESNCCRSTYCSKCATNIQDNICANCEMQPFTFKESFIARLIINKMPYECTYCKEKLTYGDSDLHSSKCQQIPRRCNIGDCSFEASTKEFLIHLVTQHKTEVINRFGKSGTQPEEKVDSSKPFYTFNPLVKRDNSAGNPATLGSTGKFYCGKPFEERCSCCDGNCGPNNGCNCRACMEVDIGSRKLAPGFWVNKEGMTCRKGPNGNVYCGRKKSTRATNEYCGPIEGPQCYACKIIQEQLEGRYRGLNQAI